MRGLKIGHFTDLAQGVGASVFLFEAGATGAYWVCGSAPATHELAALDVASSVPYCHGLVFAGGSAYGLHAAAGAMRYLGERGIGHPVPTGVVPVVPAAAIYDLAHKVAVFPAADQIYQACLTASEDNVQSGRIGGGTGATVGKLVPDTQCMTGGIGRAVLSQPDGLQVIAYVVVNAVGDVYDHGKLLAAACDADGNKVNANEFLLSGRGETDLFAGTNTTLAVILPTRRWAKMPVSVWRASVQLVLHVRSRRCLRVSTATLSFACR